MLIIGKIIFDGETNYEPHYSVGCFADFLGLFLPLEVFGDDDF